MFGPQRSPTHPCLRLFLEELESRTLLSASLLDTLAAGPVAVLNPASAASASLEPQRHGHSGGGGGTTTGPYDPAQVRTAYGFDSSLQGTTGYQSYNANAGAGQTIAIIDAYNDTTLQTDLAQFDNQWGLPGLSQVAWNGTPTSTPYLQVVGINSSGSSITPVDPSQFASAAANGWDVETALDVEWAHAMAPAANILLVESSSGNSDSDMQNAVQYAAQHASIVSMSWGQTESSLGQTNEAAFDQLFQAAATGTASTGNVTFVAASGDSGELGAPIYPAVSPYVVSVGGTHLVLNSSSNTISTETGWGNIYDGSYSLGSDLYGGSGGGYSAYELEPAYEANYASSNYLGNKVLSGTLRGNPDVAYNADPNTGFYVYDSGSGGSWYEVGGTSAGAPQWSALIALADQSRGTAAPLSTSATLTALYQAAQASSSYTSDFHDITSGNNGYPAGPGYDLVTGLGSPHAQSIVNLLSGTQSPPPLVAASGTSGAKSNTSGHVHPSAVVADSATFPTSIGVSAAAVPGAIDPMVLASSTQTSTASPSSFNPLGMSAIIGAGQISTAAGGNSASQVSSPLAAAFGFQLYAPGRSSVSSPSAIRANSLHPFPSESADGVPAIGADDSAEWGDGVPLVLPGTALVPLLKGIKSNLAHAVPAKERSEDFLPDCDAFFRNEAGMALLAEETLAPANSNAEGPSRLGVPGLALLGVFASTVWMAPEIAEETRKRRGMLFV